MNHQKTNKIEILQSRIAVVYGFLAFASFCPYSCTVALCVVGGFFILEANMQQHRKYIEVKENPDRSEIEVQATQWNTRSIQKDARRFEQIVKEMRQKLGLEVSSV